MWLPPSFSLLTLSSPPGLKFWEILEENQGNCVAARGAQER